MPPPRLAKPLERRQRVVEQPPAHRRVDVTSARELGKLDGSLGLNAGVFVGLREQRQDPRPPRAALAEVQMGLLGRVPGKAATQRRDEGVRVRLGAGLLLAQDLEEAATPPPGPLRERAVEVPQDDPAHGSTVPSTATSSPSCSTRTSSVTRSRPCRIAAAVAASTSRTGKKWKSLSRRQDPLRIGILDPKGAHLGAPEAPAVPAQGIRDRADIRARTDAEVERHDLTCIRDDVQLIDPRPPHRHLQGDAATGQPVRALTPDLYGRDGGDRQLHALRGGRSSRACSSSFGRNVPLPRSSLPPGSPSRSGDGDRSR